MTSYVPANIRRIVNRRANGQCEYCLIKENDTFLGLQIDHIISEKHGGESEAENLAVACTYCNRYKGTDVGSISPLTQDFVRFYNPRSDNWNEHFAIQNLMIAGKTEIGKATARILQFNTDERLEERAEYIRWG